jgi:hypothetical protein
MVSRSDQSPSTVEGNKSKDGTIKGCEEIGATNRGVYLPNSVRFKSFVSQFKMRMQHKIVNRSVTSPKYLQCTCEMNISTSGKNNISIRSVTSAAGMN